MDTKHPESNAIYNKQMEETFYTNSTDAHS